MTDIQNIRQRAESVKNATQIGENTAERVGSVLVDSIDAIVGQANELAKKADKTDLDKHENAYTGDYLSVPDFALDESVSQLAGSDRYQAVKNLGNAWLDGITFDMQTDVKYIGRCKLFWDGVNIECYNYVCSWADQTGIQQLTGAVKVGDDGKAEVSTTQNVLFRTYQDGVWGVWQSYNAEHLADPTRQIESINTAELDACKDDFASIWWKAKCPVAYRLMLTQKTYTQCIGTLLMWVDGSTTWLHQIVIGSFGINSDGSPSWIIGSGIATFRIFHRGFAKDSEDWYKWQEVGGTGVTGRLDTLYTGFENMSKAIAPILQSESDRQSAEQSRVKAEQNRTSAETDRVNAERLRTVAEQERADNEQTRGDSFAKQTDAVNTALKNCVTATEGAEKVDASLSEENVLTVTDRDGQTKSVDLASLEDVAGIVDDVRHLDETMGAYTERESITLTAAETNKAVSADGVKVTKQGWAIAEFTAEKGNVYLFKPGVTDGSVCIFAEKITSVETRGIDYTYTYNEDGTIATATATYLGKTHTYTYTWGTDAQGNKTAAITENGVEVVALPMTYETQVGTYAPLVRLNADAELPKDGYCRYMSHFKGNSAIKIAVSYKVGSADLTMKVTRDGVLASISTQLGNLSQKEDETRNKMEEYHRSYIELLFKEDWTITVDNKSVLIPGRVKTKVYPLRQLSMGSRFGDGDTISKVPLLWADASHLDTSNFTSMKYMFMGCTGITSLDVSGWDTSKVTNMSAMFRSCTGITSLDVSGWDTSKVTNMSAMFRDCTGITSLDVSGWDTSKVTNMSAMFINMQSIKSIKGLSTLVKAACQYAPTFINNLPAIDLDLSGWDTSGVKALSLMCYMSAIKRLDASGDGWVFPNLTQTYRPFAGVNGGVVLGKNFFNMPQVAQFDFRDVYGWKKEDVVLSLVTNSYDRKANGLNDLTIGMRNDQKAHLSEDDIATMTAKGYIIA